MLLALLFAAALDTAAAPPATSAPPPEAKQKAKSEMICRYDEVTGTHFRQRVCMTREQAEEATQRDQDRVQELQRERTRTKPGFSPGS